MMESKPSPEMVRAAETLERLSSLLREIYRTAREVGDNAHLVTHPPNGMHDYYVEKANWAVTKAKKWAGELEESNQDEEETPEQRIMRKVVIAEIRFAAGKLEKATERWDS